MIRRGFPLFSNPNVDRYDYSPWMHCPSVSEREPQGWIMNWMTDRLAVYQFWELESTERFGERMFWTNHFNERILEIRNSKKELLFPSLWQQDVTCEPWMMCTLSHWTAALSITHSALWLVGWFWRLAVQKDSWGRKQNTHMDVEKEGKLQH